MTCLISAMFRAKLDSFTSNAILFSLHINWDHMAKTSVVLRNERRKELVEKQREKRAELKKQAVNMKLSDEERYAARVKLQKLSPNGSKVRVKNRCQITGRARGVYRKFMLSRIKFREFAHAALIPGVTKSSW